MGAAEIGITIILNGRVTQRLDLVKDRILVGRSAECDVRIDDAGVSRSHALITSKAGSLSVEDLGSSNGTLVNGKRTRSAVLHNGDIVQIARFSLHISIVEELAGSTSARAALKREQQTVPMSSGRRQWSPVAAIEPATRPPATR